MTKILVISMDNEKGQKRRSFLNYDYTRIKGVDGSDNKNPYVNEVKKKMKLRYNANQKTIDGFAGNVASHLKAMDYIVKNKMNNVILNEDDSLQKKDIPKNLPNEITLLSGQISHPKSWEKDKEWKKNGENLKILSAFKTGANDIDYQKFRWTQSNSIYFPSWKDAKRLLDKLRNEVKSYKSYDMVLSQNKLIKKIYYPAIFNHHDKLNSSLIATNPGVIVDYVKVGNTADIDYPDYS
jgi:hypothetical protein